MQGQVSMLAQEFQLKLENKSEKRGIYLQNICVKFAIGIGDASCIQVGQALGKGDPAQAKRAAKIGYILSGSGLEIEELQRPSHIIVQILPLQRR